MRQIWANGILGVQDLYYGVPNLINAVVSDTCHERLEDGRYRVKILMQLAGGQQLEIILTQ